MAESPETTRKRSASAFKYTSPLLQGATAATLFGESYLHGASFPHVLHAGIGYAQRTIGLGGMGYYGYKAYKKRDWKSTAMFAGYTGFTLHGLARMWEAHEHHQKHTPRFGSFAAMSKMVAPKPEYAPDLFANMVEWSHAMPKPSASARDFRSTGVRMLQSFKPETLLRSQRWGAALLGASALYSAFEEHRR